MIYLRQNPSFETENWRRNTAIIRNLEPKAVFIAADIPKQYPVPGYLDEPRGFCASAIVAKPGKSSARTSRADEPSS